MKQEIGSGGAREGGRKVTAHYWRGRRRRRWRRTARKDESAEKMSGPLVHLMQTCCHQPYARCHRVTVHGRACCATSPGACIEAEYANKRPSAVLSSLIHAVIHIFIGSVHDRALHAREITEKVIVVINGTAMFHNVEKENKQPKVMWSLNLRDVCR